MTAIESRTAGMLLYVCCCSFPGVESRSFRTECVSTVCVSVVLWCIEINCGAPHVTGINRLANIVRCSAIPLLAAQRRKREHASFCLSKLLSQNYLRDESNKKCRGSILGSPFHIKSRHLLRISSNALKRNK